MKTYYEKKEKKKLTITSNEGFIVTELGYFKYPLELIDSFRYKEGFIELEPVRNFEGEVVEKGICYALTGSPTLPRSLKGIAVDPEGIEVVAVIPLELINIKSSLGGKFYHICRTPGEALIQANEEEADIISLPDNEIFFVEHMSFTDKDDNGEMLKDAHQEFGDEFYNIFTEK